VVVLDAGLAVTSAGALTCSAPMTSRGCVAVSCAVTDCGWFTEVSIDAGATARSAAGVSAYHGTTSAILGAVEPPCHTSLIAYAAAPPASSSV